MKTHQDLIAASLAKAATQSFKGNQWGKRHVAAWHTLSSKAHPIVQLIEGCAAYADQMHREYDSGPGDDGVLGDPWASILLNVRSLLNGETWNLDCGTVDALILAMLSLEGFDENGKHESDS